MGEKVCCSGMQVVLVKVFIISIIFIMIYYVLLYSQSIKCAFVNT